MYRKKQLRQRQRQRQEHTHTHTHTHTHQTVRQTGRLTVTDRQKDRQTIRQAGMQRKREPDR